MKKLSLSAFLFLGLNINAQTYSTGTIQLDIDFTAKIETNPTTVTVTLIGPSDKWLGLGFNATSMVISGGTDAIIVSGTTPILTDKRLTSKSSGGQADDQMQDWTTIQNTVLGTTRTVIATRALNSGDSTDYTFSNTATSLNLIWAKGSSLVFGYHESSGIAINNSFTLTTNSFQSAGYKLFPNPSKEFLQIELPQDVASVTIEVYDILGKKVLSSNVSANEKLNISNLKTGNYLVKASTKEGNWVSTNLLVQ